MNRSNALRFVAIAFLVPALMSACSALRVYEQVPAAPCPPARETGVSDPVRHVGLPFFRKVGALQQTTTRLRVYRSVTLTVQEDMYEATAGGETKLSTRAIDSLRFAVKEASWNEVAVKAVIAGLALPAGEPPDLIAVIKQLVRGAGLVAIRSAALGELFDVERLAGGTPHELEGLVNDQVQDNLIVDVPVVEYDTTHFVNAVAPLFGTGNLTAKLATDGTLTEVTAAVDATKLADEFPLSEFLSSKLLPPAAAAALVEGASRRVQYRLVVSAVQEGYRYTLTATNRIQPGGVTASTGARLAPLTYRTAQTIARRPLSEAGAGGPTAKPILSVSGTVSQLPQEPK